MTRRNVLLTPRSPDRTPLLYSLPPYILAGLRAVAAAPQRKYKASAGRRSEDGPQHA